MTRILLTILALLLTAPAVASEHEAFSLSVTPGIITVPKGSSVAIRFTATNRSHQPRYIYRSTFDFVHLAITNAQGKALLGGLPPPPPPPGQPAIANLVLLAPGQSFSRVEHFDLGQAPTDKAGTYVFYFIVSIPNYVKGRLSPDAVNYFFSRDNVVHVTVTQK